MYETLHAALDAWPSDPLHRPNGVSTLRQPSQLYERITFGDEDELRSPSSVFKVTPGSYPTEKVFIPPYFVPPASINQADGNVAKRLQQAFQQSVAPSEPEREQDSGYLAPESNPAGQVLRQLAQRPANVRFVETSADAAHSANTVRASCSLSPQRFSHALLSERDKAFSDTARQAFRAMIKAPGYVNRYRLSPSKHQRILDYLSNPGVDPTNDDGSKDHQTRYQAAHWTLIEGKLYRKAESKKDEINSLRRHIDADEAWDVLTSQHLKSGHLGRDRLRKRLERDFIG